MKTQAEHADFMTKYCGCDKLVCQWFESYFDNRSQIVQCTDVSGKQVKSTPLAVSRGVVQGSVLGPTLYSVYTYDLLDNMRYGSAHMYADDTQVLVHTPLDVTHINNTVNLVNDDLSAVDQWSRENGLVLNAQKCSFILLGTRHQVEFLRDANP